MNFIDRADILIAAGDGGNGKLSFRREKFVAKGGPDGGDGGNGADVVFVASRNENTLADFRYKKEIVAKSGAPGEQRNKHGRSAETMLVPVPVGTVVKGQKGNIIADLTFDGEKAVIARGGKGGFGNAHFVSSVRQAPRIVEKGEPGEKLNISVELKLIADVGVVGLPNAGKSTFLSVISNARPEIADYAFTTLTPNLGVAQIDKETAVLFADIPGLIEGAAQGKGLGDDFLRHIERTLVLVHVVDAYQTDIVKAYKIIQNELAAYQVDLSNRPQVILLNKIEGLDQKKIKSLVSKLTKVAPKGTPIYAISAQAHIGLKEALYAVKNLLQQAKDNKAIEHESQEIESSGLPVLRLSGNENSWKVEKNETGSYIVTGTKIEKFAIRSDMTNPESVARIRDIMKRMGITHELIRQGVKPGDQIIINDMVMFKY